jgi:hypothetical protein
MLPIAWIFDQWEAQHQGIRWLVLLIAAVSVAVQIRGVLANPLGDRQTIGPIIGGDENASIYIPHVGPWGIELGSDVDILLVFFWSRLPHLRYALGAIAIGLLTTALLSGWYTVHQLGMRGRDLRSILPGASPRHLLAAVGCLMSLTVPAGLEQLLIARTSSLESNQTARLPKQFWSMRLNTSNRLSGSLHAPVRGDYVFYRQAPGMTQVYLDSQPVFSTLAGAAVAGVVKLEAGFHRLELDGISSEPASLLYWTIPGNAHYKQQIPRLYLAGAPVAVEQRLAIALAHWKWLLIAIGVTGCLFFGLSGTPKADATSPSH